MVNEFIQQTDHYLMVNYYILNLIQETDHDFIQQIIMFFLNMCKFLS